MVHPVLSLCFASLLFGATSQASSLDRNDSVPVASISSGFVLGTTAALPFLSALVHKFLGIPYAVSPPLRFAAPADPQPWSTPLNATALKPGCVAQVLNNFTRDIFDHDPAPESEDCLYLNVYTPSTPAPSDGRAVMFWIHGGDLQYGSGSNDDYDGSSLAANQDVVVVTISYRLNVYGFPGSPEIPIDARNLGFLDQRKALGWVQQNIGAFGGDPTKVTIFGESAGGYSVKELFAVPPDPLPFRAAIMQSLGATLTPNGTASWETLASALGCSNATSPLACMQAADATRITSIIEENELRFPPVVDNKTRISHAEDAMRAGTTAQIPLMIGNNADEGSSFASSYANAQVLLEYALPNDTAYQAAVLASYPPGLQGANLTAQILTDSSFTCGSSFFVNASSAAGFPTWRYFFNASFPNTDVFPGAGAYHTAEIPLVFGTFPREGSTERQARLSTVMQKVWADFAKDPTSGPGWPAAGVDGHDVMVFGGSEGGLASTVSSASLDGMCTVWETMNEMLGI